MMQEREIRFRSGDVELAGTMAVPDAGGPFPCVLFITGSGQVDRNENHKKLRVNAFYDISHNLAQHGIASLRYDKRGVGHSGGNYWPTGFYDNVQDAGAALQCLKQQRDVQPQNVFIVGHSEGAFLAVKLASSGAKVSGIVLLAGGGPVRRGRAKVASCAGGQGIEGIQRVVHPEIPRRRHEGPAEKDPENQAIDEGLVQDRSPRENQCQVVA